MSQGFDLRVGGNGLMMAVDELVRGHMLEAHTALPGEILDFDPVTQTATVQLSVQREMLGTDQTVTILQSVPVMIQGGGGFSVTFPITAGDPCLVVFCERGIGNWYVNGGNQPAETRRHHHLSDAVCIPGLRPAPDALANYDADNFTVRSDDGQTQLCITPAGGFALTNGAEELLTIIDELITLVRDQQTQIIAGSSAGLHGLQVADVTALNALQTRLATLIK